MHRNETKRIKVGSIEIGGDAPISVQSMCNTKTDDVEATLEQISALVKAGCDIVRLAVPNREAAEALSKIRAKTNIPLVADIHFDHKLALAAVEAGFDKIRINPGNIGSVEQVKMVADACRANGTAMRIGVNAGSLEKRFEENGGSAAENLVASAMDHINLLEGFNFDRLCISVKASNVQKTVEAYRLLAQRTSYPLHLGVTETGTAYMGLIKSSAGIGSLLLDGIGSTLRVSLTADPVEEVKAGISLLKAVGLRRAGVEIISCPTCGRTDIDLMTMVERVETLLKDIKTPLTVAVMGCVVNGPGEARDADYGLAGGKGQGALFRHGEIVGKYPEEALLEALVELVLKDLK